MDKLFKTALHDDFDQDEQKMGRSPKLPDHSKRDTKSDGYIPSVPGNLLDLIRKGTVQQADGLLLKWKKLWNEEKRHIFHDELLLDGTRGSNHRKNNKDYSKYGKRGSGNNKNDKKGNKHLKKQCLSLSTKEPDRGKTRRTSFKMRNTAAGVTQTTALVTIKDSDETKSTVFTDSSYSDDTDMDKAVSNKDEK